MNLWTLRDNACRMCDRLKEECSAHNKRIPWTVEPCCYKCNHEWFEKVTPEQVRDIMHGEG